MRSRTVSPVLLVIGLVAGLFAVPSLGSPLCGEDDAEVALPELPAPLDGLAERTEELVLPCASVESGLFGPWCVDASVYLVTHTGTLLCRVSLPAVDLALVPGSDLEDRDPAPLPSRPPLPAPAGGLASAVKDAARPLAIRLPTSLARRQQPPHPVYAEPPFVPG